MFSDIVLCPVEAKADSTTLCVGSLVSNGQMLRQKLELSEYVLPLLYIMRNQ